jgi:hypothetical protein
MRSTIFGMGKRRAGDDATPSPGRVYNAPSVPSVTPWLYSSRRNSALPCVTTRYR